MSPSRQRPDDEVLVRFWTLNHHRAEPILWPQSPWAKLVFAQEGTLIVETANEHHVLPPNRAMLIPAGEPHPSRTLARAKVRTLYFSPRCALPGPFGIMEVRLLFRELISEACRVGPLMTSSDNGNALATLLLNEIKAAPRKPTSIRMPTTEWVWQWAAQYLDEPTVPLPTDFSHRTLERRLVAETGLTLGQWRQQAKALRGLRALSEGSTVLEAAMLAGFETSSGFIQSFRRQFGTTPGRMSGKNVALPAWA